MIKDTFITFICFCILHVVFTLIHCILLYFVFTVSMCVWHVEIKRYLRRPVSPTSAMTSKDKVQSHVGRLAGFVP